MLSKFIGCVRRYNREETVVSFLGTRTALHVEQLIEPTTETLLSHGGTAGGYDFPFVPTGEHPVSQSRAERAVFRLFFFLFFFSSLHHVKSSRFFGCAWASAARRRREEGVDGPAKGREQLAPVVTVRWYPVLVSCGGENTKKGLRRLALGRRLSAFRGSR